MNKSLLSSNNQKYETPQPLFDSLNSMFHFDIDVCATYENTKCQRYYTPEIDGLKQPWHNHKTCWCNPPYRETLKWIEKAYQESLLGATVVCLIAARTDTRYFQDYIFPYAKAICFIRGRLRFSGEKNPATFPSAIVVFSSEQLDQEKVKVLRRWGNVLLNNYTEPMNNPYIVRDEAEGREE